MEYKKKCNINDENDIIDIVDTLNDPFNDQFDVIMDPFDFIVSNYLDIKDIHNMRLTDKLIHNHINDAYIMLRIKRIMVNRLKIIFGKEFQNFVYAMTNASAASIKSQ
jgi:hypothetical protein